MAGILACAFAVFWFLQDDIKEENLPVIREFTEAYHEGIASLKLLSTEAITEFYDQPITERIAVNQATTTPNPEISTSTTPATLHIRSTWDQEAILQKLKAAGFSAGKRKAAKRILDYIELHRVLVLQDMRETNILASVKLAQAILESGAGRSKLAKATNNHFGIKALAGKSARRKIKSRRYNELSDDEFVYRDPAIGAYNFHDDHRYDRFEIYKSVGDSYDRHNQLLKRKCTPGQKGCYSWIWARYKVGEDYDISSMANVYLKSSKIAPEEFFNGRTTVPYYAAAAAGLKMAGYATSPTYHKKLFYLIETYELWRFDLDLIRAIEDARHPVLNTR